MNEIQISPVKARELTKQIQAGIETVWQLVERAYQTQAWKALNYDSWDAYCDAEFKTSRLQLPRSERREVVASMREVGMSTRAIAAATGISQPTVRREINRGESNDSPESSPVKGTDGKTYPARSQQIPAPEVEVAERPAKVEKRRPLTKHILNVSVEAAKLNLSLHKLLNDDRFDYNAQAVRDGAMSDLERLVRAVSKVAQRVDPALTIHVERTTD